MSKFERFVEWLTDLIINVGLTLLASWMLMFGVAALGHPVGYSGSFYATITLYAGAEMCILRHRAITDADDRRKARRKAAR